MSKCLRCKLWSKFIQGITFNCREHRIIILGFNHNRNRRMVFSTRSNHCWTTNINRLHGVFQSVRSSNRLLKLVKVHCDHRNRSNSCRRHRLNMRRIVSITQQPSVNHRVQSLDPSIQHFWETSDFTHINHLHTALTQCLGRPSSAQNLKS